MITRALVLALLHAPAGTAAAQVVPVGELPIEWQAPESCPDTQALLRRLGALLGEEPRDLGKLTRVRAVVQETSTAKQLTLDVEASGHHSTRQFESSHCTDLVDAAALAIALALHGESTPAPASAPTAGPPVAAPELDAQPPAAERHPARLGDRRGSGAGLGGAAAARAGGGGAGAPAARRLEPGWAWPVPAEPARGPGQRRGGGLWPARRGRARLSTAVRARRAGRRLRHPGGGAVSRDGRQPAAVPHVTGSVAAAGGGLEAQARASGDVWLQLRLEPVVPIGRRSYAVNATEVVHAPAALDLRFYVGLGVYAQ